MPFRCCWTWRRTPPANDPETIGIVMDNTAASVAFVSPIIDGDALAANNLELVVNEVFTPPLANATPLIQRVRSRRPDLLLLLPTAVSDAKLLLEKMNEFGLGRGRLPTISNGSAMGDPDLAANMPTALLEGVMSIVANWSTSGQEQMIADYMAFSGEPWMTQNPLCALAISGCSRKRWSWQTLSTVLPLRMPAYDGYQRGCVRVFCWRTCAL